MKKVNLGSGQFNKEGFINVDFDSHTSPDVVHNLDVFPYPFESNSVDYVEADHVLEHLSDPWKTMAEIQRILKPGSTCSIRVPHFSRGFSHPDHKRGFDVTFPYYFDPAFKGGYSGTELQCESVTLTWFAQPYFKKTVFSPGLFYFLTFVGTLVDFFAWISPPACSRIWCFWVGGFEEVSFILKKPIKK